MMRARGRVALSLGLIAIGPGCSSLAPGAPFGSPPPTPATEVAEKAEMALVLEDFVTARHGLLRLATTCDGSDEARRALLLLAAAELDPGNPRGSPDEAARLAAHFLLLPQAPLGELALARVVYRIAVDRGGVLHWSEGEATEGALPMTRPDALADCTPASESVAPSAYLPTTPGVTTADRVETLLGEISVRSDSIATLTERVATWGSEIARLEAEIDRITSLLTIAAPDDTARIRR